MDHLIIITRIICAEQMIHLPFRFVYDKLGVKHNRISLLILVNMIIWQSQDKKKSAKYATR